MKVSESDEFDPPEISEETDHNQIKPSVIDGNRKIVSIDVNQNISKYNFVDLIRINLTETIEIVSGNTSPEDISKLIVNNSKIKSIIIKSNNRIYSDLFNDSFFQNINVTFENCRLDKSESHNENLSLRSNSFKNQFRKITLINCSRSFSEDIFQKVDYSDFENNGETVILYGQNYDFQSEPKLESGMLNRKYLSIPFSIITGFMIYFLTR